MPSQKLEEMLTPHDNGELLKFRFRLGKRLVDIIYEGKLFRNIDASNIDPEKAVRSFIRTVKNRRNMNKSDTGIDYDFLYSRLDLARRRANKKGLSFSITVKDLFSLGDKQKWRCALTKIPFKCKEGEPWSNPYTLSIDRINNSKGYEIGNIRLVLHAINAALGPWGEDEFAEIARQFLIQRHLRQIATDTVRTNSENKLTSLNDISRKTAA